MDKFHNAHTTEGDPVIYVGSTPHPVTVANEGL